MSLIDIMEEITFHSGVDLPKEKTKLAFPCEFEVVSYWVREDIDKEKYVDFSLEIIDPNKEKVGGGDSKVDFPLGDKKRMRTILKSKVFIFTTDGQYLFRVKLNEEKERKLVAEIPVEIKLKKKIAH